MKHKTLQFFFLGLMIAFTLGVLIVSVIISAFDYPAALPVSMIWQVFALSALCSLINLVYRSEKLKFLWQSIIGYVLTTATIIICGLIFGWYSYGGSNVNSSMLLISFFGYTLFYLITWIIIWQITKAKKKRLNEKLNEYKLK